MKLNDKSSTIRGKAINACYDSQKNFPDVPYSMTRTALHSRMIDLVSMVENGTLDAIDLSILRRIQQAD